MIPTEERCQARVSGTGSWGAFHQHQCEKRAVVTREGKRYCKIHDPEYIKQKDDTSRKQYEQALAKRRLEWQAPMLLSACKEALEASHNPMVERILSKAINKAEGRS